MANKQQGVVLVISMIMLLLLTMIGTSSMQTAGQQEKLSRHYKDKYSAIQAAEAALKAGEAKINGAQLSDFGGSIAGLLAKSAADPDPWNKMTWNNAIQINSGISNVSEQPRYYIKHLSTDTVVSSGPGGSGGSGGINIASPTYGGAKRQLVQSGPTTTNTGFFAITAKGAGDHGVSQVLLRSYFYRKF